MRNPRQSRCDAATGLQHGVEAFVGKLESTFSKAPRTATAPAARQPRLAPA